MKEYGGYLDFYSYNGEEYHKNAVALNTGRNALVYLVKAKNIRKLYLPSFLCDSVSNVCNREKIAYEYYSIDSNFLPIFTGSLCENEYLYIVNYYGQINNDMIRVLYEKYRNIIVDNVQAFFQYPVSGIDTIYSCRKFLGVPDGAYLYTDAKYPEPIKTDQSSQRFSHLLGRFETEEASMFYDAFKANDKSFVDLPVMHMSKLTHNLLKSFNYAEICNQRNKNYQMLNTELGTINLLKNIMPNGPYCYPLYLENGGAIRKQLINNKIYVPVLWPNTLDNKNEIDSMYSLNILPIPCDQRYSEKDMLEIASVIKKLAGGKNG